MRFTKKDRYGHFYTNEANCRNVHSLDGKKLEGEFYENQTLAIDGNAIEKLGKLEDIEERYGIEILTVYKAMVNGCYYRYNGKIEHFIPDERNFICLNLDNRSMDLMYASSYENACHVGKCLFFESYGGQWALTKEELYD